MSREQTNNCRKLKPEDISLSVRANPNGNLDLLIGLYEMNGWKQHIKIELIGFPELCHNLDAFKNLAVRA